MWFAIVVSAALAILLLDPKALTEPIQVSLTSILPLAGIAVVLIGAWAVVRWLRRRGGGPGGGSGDGRSVTLSLRGGS
jgi:hypothetical protein